MADRSSTCSSVLSDVIQELFWNTKTKTIQVVHEFNLEPYKNVRWRSVKEYLPDHPDYVPKCKIHGINPELRLPLTEFEYDEYDDRAIDYVHAMKFPESGDYYFLTGLPRAVAVTKNKTIGEASKTSGVALST